MKRPIVLAIVLALAACGSAQGLRPPEGQSLPTAPYGATATPTPGQLLTPSTQARPAVVDELLKNSDERRSDGFDLPPQR